MYWCSLFAPMIWWKLWVIKFVVADIWWNESYSTMLTCWSNMRTIVPGNEQKIGLSFNLQLFWYQYTLQYTKLRLKENVFITRFTHTSYGETDHKNTDFIAYYLGVFHFFILLHVLTLQCWGAFIRRCYSYWGLSVAIFIWRYFERYFFYFACM